MFLLISKNLRKTTFTPKNFIITFSTFLLFQIGASFHLTNVQVYVVDLKECKPFGNNINSTSNSPFTTSNPFSTNTSLRKSFSKADRPPSLKTKTLDVKTIEESTSGTDPEEESMADITNVTDYQEIFKGRGCKSTKYFFHDIFFYFNSCFIEIHLE